MNSLIDGSDNTVDICSVEWGGGYCTKDEECHGKGLCINNQCVCYSNWLCPYCSMGLNEDILIGAKCGDYVHGGGACSDDSDCYGNGVCLDGSCMCNSGYVCSHCSSLAINIVKGSRSQFILSNPDEECPCDGVNCGKNGMCIGGQCVCDNGYKGQFCQINVLSSYFSLFRSATRSTVGSMACAPSLLEVSACVMKGIRERAVTRNPLEERHARPIRIAEMELAESAIPSPTLASATRDGHAPGVTKWEVFAMPLR